MYYGVRYYDRTIIGWTQSDPLYRFAPDAAWNHPRNALLYTYSLQNPNRYFDPDGQDVCGVVSSIPGAGLVGGAICRVARGDSATQVASGAASDAQKPRTPTGIGLSFLLRLDDGGCTNGRCNPPNGGGGPPPPPGPKPPGGPTGVADIDLPGDDTSTTPTPPTPSADPQTDDIGTDNDTGSVGQSSDGVDDSNTPTDNENRPYHEKGGHPKRTDHHDTRPGGHRNFRKKAQEQKHKNRVERAEARESDGEPEPPKPKKPRSE